MNRLIAPVLEDLYTGRESWRVLLALAVPSFIAGAAFGLMG